MGERQADLGNSGAGSEGLMPLKWVGRNGTACEETAKGLGPASEDPRWGGDAGKDAQVVKGKTWAGGDG